MKKPGVAQKELLWDTELKRSRMKIFLLALLSLAMATSGVTQETGGYRSSRRGEAAGYSSRSATAFSMMGWGVGLAVGIATLCALLDQNTSHSHNH